MKSRSEPVAEISAGELIGEIGFFSGQCRTATVVAARDSAVAKLGRTEFDEVVAANPKIYQAILNSLAGRLAQMTAYAPAITQRTAVRTIAIVAGGQGGFIRRTCSDWVPDRERDLDFAQLILRTGTRTLAPRDGPDSEHRSASNNYP